jgi:hypothetical protein
MAQMSVCSHCYRHFLARCSRCRETAIKHDEIHWISLAIGQQVSTCHSSYFQYQDQPACFLVPHFDCVRSMTSPSRWPPALSKRRLTLFLCPRFFRCENTFFGCGSPRSPWQKKKAITKSQLVQVYFPIISQSCTRCKVKKNKFTGTGTYLTRYSYTPKIGYTPNHPF